MVNTQNTGVSARSTSDKLADFVRSQTGVESVLLDPLTPDASTRTYFRLIWRSQSAVAAVYPEPFDPEVQPFLDVTNLFQAARLPVPQIYAVDGPTGIIIQEDLGDDQLARLGEKLTAAQRDAYFKEAIAIIARIQAATGLAYERDSIASRLAFDEAKLIWELQFFVEHYFGSLRREKLRRGEMAELSTEMNDVAAELSACRRVLCHRDYHTANLLVDGEDRVRVVDYQDARMGPASYDLVSLLLDRRLAPPDGAEINHYGEFFLGETIARGLPKLDAAAFGAEFRLMTVQRCLKAIGTFANQTANYGRHAAYARFIRPMLLTVIEAAETLNRFPALRRILKARADDEIAGAS